MSETTNETTNAAPEVTKPKLTRVEKLQARAVLLQKRIAEDTLEYNEIANELNNLAALANLAAGTTVTIRIGRADTAREVVGLIAGVKDEEDGSKKYKVTYGSGFDADIVVVTAGQIVSIGEQVQTAA